MNFNIPLIDGSITGESRADVVARMAQRLIKYDAFRCEGDAIRSLIATREFSTFCVLRFVDDARQAAMQELVAAEMVKP